MAETPATLPFAEAALARGLTYGQLRGLKEKHCGSFLTRCGGRGRGRSHMVDMAALDALLATKRASDAATEASRRKAGVLDRLPDTLALRLAEMFHGGELTHRCPGLKVCDAARIIAYVWTATVETTRAEMVKAGLRPPPLVVPDKIVDIERF